MTCDQMLRPPVIKGTAPHAHPWSSPILHSPNWGSHAQLPEHLAATGHSCLQEVDGSGTPCKWGHLVFALWLLCPAQCPQVHPRIAGGGISWFFMAK